MARARRTLTEIYDDGAAHDRAEPDRLRRRRNLEPGTAELQGGLAETWDKPFTLGSGDAAVATTIPETVFVMFQMTFAIITPALITGATADLIVGDDLVRAFTVRVMLEAAAIGVVGGDDLRRLGRPPARHHVRARRPARPLMRGRRR